MPAIVETAKREKDGTTRAAGRHDERWPPGLALTFAAGLSALLWALVVGALVWLL